MCKKTGFIESSSTLVLYQISGLDSENFKTKSYTRSQIKVWSSRVWDYVFEIQRKLDTRDRCFMTRAFSSILNSLFVSFNFFDNFHRKKLQIKVKTDT